MIRIGEYVLYKQEGVCRVSDLAERTMAGLSRHAYYTLKPISYEGTIYAPVESEGQMRAVLGREEALALLERAPRIQPLLCDSKDKKAIVQFCQELIDPDDAESFLRAMKSIQARRSGKVLSSPEEEVYRRAERCLSEEISVALDIGIAEAKEVIAQALGK